MKGTDLFVRNKKNAFFENNIVNVYKIVYHDLLQNLFLKTLFETLNIFTRNFLHLRNQMMHLETKE